MITVVYIFTYSYFSNFFYFNFFSPPSHCSMSTRPNPNRMFSTHFLLLIPSCWCRFSRGSNSKQKWFLKMRTKSSYKTLRIWGWCWHQPCFHLFLRSSSVLRCSWENSLQKKVRIFFQYAIRSICARLCKQIAGVLTQKFMFVFVWHFPLFLAIKYWVNNISIPCRIYQFHLV